MLQRFNPTADKAAELRKALSDAGCKARVARQRFAFRIVADDIELAVSVAVSAGFGGPAGGRPVRNGLCEAFAYDVRKAA